MADKKKTTVKPRAQSAALRQLDLAELQKKLGEERDRLMRARFEHATAQLEDTALLKTLRQDIARIQTIIHEKSAQVRK